MQEDNEGCSLIGWGGILIVATPFVVFMVYLFYHYGEQAPHAGRLAVMVGALLLIVAFALITLSLLIDGVKPTTVLTAALILDAIPVATYLKASGTGHGYTWLWTLLWMWLAALIIGGTAWLTTRSQQN